MFINEVRPHVAINKNQQFTNIDSMFLIIQVKKILTSPVQAQYSLPITPHQKRSTPKMAAEHRGKLYLKTVSIVQASITGFPVNREMERKNKRGMQSEGNSFVTRTVSHIRIQII